MELIKKKKDLSEFDKKKLATFQLELILTQKCNLNCAHCMRGDSTNKEITPEVLDALFSKFIYIHGLSLGGGEISLTPHLVRLVTKKLKEHKTIVHRIDFTSNGTFVSEDFLNALSELRDYVLSFKQFESHVTLDESENQEPLIACFSFDDFHIESILKAGYKVEDIFANIAQYQHHFSDKAIECRLASDVDIINAGRAERLNSPIKKIKPIKPNQYLFPYQILKDKIFIGGMPTISCNGDFIPVNIPFSQEKQYAYGNIVEDKFSTIASRMNTIQTTTDKEFNKINLKNMNKMFSSTRLWKRYAKIKGNKKMAYFNYLLKKKANEMQ